VITRRRFLQLAGAGVLGGLAIAAYPFVEALAQPQVMRYALTPQRWTPGLHLRIAVIADIHACEPWMGVSRIEGICAQAQALEPDVVLLLGDYTTGMGLVLEQVHSADWARALGKLSAPLGIHAVLGNHDYWEDLAFQLDQSATPLALRALRDVGIRTYRNEAIRLEKNGIPFWLAGLDDQMALLPGRRFDRPRLLSIGDLDATLAQVTDDAPVVLMAHEPDIFPSVPDRIGLTLSGHTHGGQINLFGWRPWSASLGSRRFPAGQYVAGERQLIVSRGLGCSAIPLRLGSWPEILLVELGTA
jgi:predicted MPP superfamily phosphohydrolase